MTSIEQLILEGGAGTVGGKQGNGSPSRSVSPTTSDELKTSDGDSDAAGARGTTRLPLASHSGPQTGVKGVRADAAQHAHDERARKADQINAVNSRMEAMALSKQRTWKEDEEDRRHEAETGEKPGYVTSRAQRDADDGIGNHDDEDVGADSDAEDQDLKAIRMRRMQTLQSQAASQESRRKRMAGEDETDARRLTTRTQYGHLREVGHDQFVQAVDGGCDSSTYVVVHIYVKYVHACAMLTSALSSLARIYPKTKFLQVRAGRIGFGSGGIKDMADDEINEDDLDEEAEDVVPTLLVYKAGKVVANLVRVDLEAEWGDGSERCIKDILRGHNALH